MRQDKSTPQVDEAVIAEALRTSIPTARCVISDLEDAGFVIMRKPRGDLAAISEAVRTGNWTPVTEWDWKAWLGAVHAGFITKEAVLSQDEDDIARFDRTVPLTQGAITATVLNARDTVKLAPGKRAGIHDREDAEVLGVIWTDGVISFSGDIDEMREFKAQLARLAAMPATEGFL